MRKQAELSGGHIGKQMQCRSIRRYEAPVILQLSQQPTCIFDVGKVVPSRGPGPLVDKHSSQLIPDALPPIGKGRGGGQIGAVGAEVGGQVKGGGEGDVACELDKVWPEALEVENQGVGGCVYVQRLVCCLVPAPNNTLYCVSAQTRSCDISCSDLGKLDRTKTEWPVSLVRRGSSCVPPSGVSNNSQVLSTGVRVVRLQQKQPRIN